MTAGKKYRSRIVFRTQLGCDETECLPDVQSFECVDTLKGARLQFENLRRGDNNVLISILTIQLIFH